MTPSEPRAISAASVLRVVDHAMLVSIPPLLVSVLVWRSDLTVLWSVIAGATLVLLGTFAWLGRNGRAAWRGAVYSAVTLGAAVGGLWTMGPITGVGVMFGLSMACASAFLSRRGLAVILGIAIVAIALRTFVGGSLDMGPLVAGKFPVDLGMWIGTAMASALLLWTARRLLGVLFAWLEDSYRRAADSYAREAAMREQVDHSRSELDELARVEMVGRLAGGVAHDMNNALAAILAAADVLTTEVATPDQRRRLAELESASHHAADLVRDLLWIGRRLPPSSTAVASIDEVVRNCMERVGRVARRMFVEDRVAHINDLAISAIHLEQILFGLVLGAERAGVSRMVISTEDVAADATRLAIVLSAGQATEAPVAREMQVQLAISAARELVAQYGGALYARDLSYVMIELPVAAGKRAVRAVTHQRTALIVEDEPMVLRRLCQLVARAGYEVASATNVADGVELLLAGPDLLITDLQLPDGSGETIALASYAANPRRPIIVCSGFSVDDVCNGPLRDAPLTFIAKPFSSTDFEAALA